MTTQQLEKIYRVVIEDLNDIETEVKVRCKPTKLSEAWRLASKELTQIKRTFGSRSKKTACAIGAIGYYFPKDANSDNLGHTNIREDAYHNIMFLTRYMGHTLDMYNDNHGWTFEDFANEAEKIGL